MKISINTWHYRRYLKLTGYPSQPTLCQYVQALVKWHTLTFLSYMGLALLIPICVPAGILLFATMLIDDAMEGKIINVRDSIRHRTLITKHYRPLIGFNRRWFPYNVLAPFYPFMMLTAIYGQYFLVALVVFVLFFTRFAKWVDGHTPTFCFPKPVSAEERVERQSILSTYLKAKKERFCPLVEFVDE